MTRKCIALASTQRSLHPRETLGRQLSLNEDGAEIPLIRETLDRGLVDWLLFRLQESENLRGEHR